MKHVCCLTSWNLHDVCFEWNGTSFPPKEEDNRTKRFHVWNVNQPQQQSEPAISHTHFLFRVVGNSDFYVCHGHQHSLNHFVSSLPDLSGF